MQRQMPDKSSVRDASMRQQLGARSEDGVEHFGPVLSQPDERQRVEGARGVRAGRAVIFATLAVAIKVVARPARWSIETAKVLAFQLFAGEDALAAGGARK